MSKKGKALAELKAKQILGTMEIFRKARGAKEQSETPAEATGVGIVDVLHGEIAHVVAGVKRKKGKTKLAFVKDTFAEDVMAYQKRGLELQTGVVRTGKGFGRGTPAGHRGVVPNAVEELDEVLQTTVNKYDYLTNIYYGGLAEGQQLAGAGTFDLGGLGGFNLNFPMPQVPKVDLLGGLSDKAKWILIGGALLVGAVLLKGK